MNKQKIINQLKYEILSLTLKPGTIISEATLSQRFGLSRTPIRDILKQLALEGYINIYPQKGSLVSYIDLESVEQIIFMRSTLEKEVAQNLCQSLSLKGQHMLRNILNEQKKYLGSANSFEPFVALDDAFHMTLFTLNNHSFVWDIIQQFNVHYTRYRKLHMLKEEKLLEIYNEHEQLLSLIIENNPKQLESLLNHHIRSDIDSTYFTETFKKYIK